MEKFLSYFKTNYRVNKPGDITWSHAVNSTGKLDRFLNNDAAMIIESDIRISSSGVAVAVHPPATESDLTFNELIERMKNSRQGLKLDFKDPEIYERCLRVLKEAELTQPILVNADILQGNGANPPKFSAVGFLALWKELFPKGILSIGWTTTANPELAYTKQNIDDMLRLCEGIDVVTFPVRACLLPNSWAELQRLIRKEGYTLSIWNNEPVDSQLAHWIKDNTDPSKTFYDFIDDDKEPIKLW